MSVLHVRRGSALARTLCLVTIGALATTGCFRGRGAGPFAFFEAAIITAAIVSTVAPPPPRVIVVPAERPGYQWQPGYWTRDGDDWVWVDGRWIELPPHYRWSPSHWEQAPDGTWHLMPGRWIPLDPNGGPPPPPPQ